MTSIRVRQPSTSAERGRTMGLVHGQEVGHRLGDRDGIHRDVGEVDPRHGEFGRAPQIRLGQVLRRDPGQEIRGMHHEVVVEPHLTRNGA